MPEQAKIRKSFFLLDVFPHGGLVIDADYQVLHWNTCLEDWTKIDREEILHTDIRDWYPQFRNVKTVKRIAEVFQGGAPSLFSSKLNHNTIPCFSSSLKPVLQQTIVTAIPSGKPGVFFALFTIQDVTDEHNKTQKIRSINRQLAQEIEVRKRAEQEITKAKLDAEQANKSKSEFLSRMSHELRTPLNAILGFSQLLLRDTPAESQTRSNLTHILNAGQHLLELINEVLNLSHVESGNLNLDITRTPIAPIIQDSVILLTPMAEEKQVELACGSEFSGQLFANIDRTRLKQVMINLISNAIKYNRPGGRVTISTRLTEHNMIEILVEDTGHGIAPKDMDSLFEPFTRFGESTDQVEGTGIGLTISKKLIHLMDGDISVKSELGKGTSIFITFAPCHTFAFNEKPVK